MDNRALILTIGLIVFLGSLAGVLTTVNQKSFTIAQISEASSQVKTYVEASNNTQLPNQVAIGNQNLTMPQLLYLQSSAVLILNKSGSSNVTFKNVTKALSPSQDLTSGTISKSEYVTLAVNIKRFMDTNGRAPNYVSTSQGKMSYESSVYTFSKIMDFYKFNKRLPATVSVSPWNYAAAENTTVNITQLGSISGVGYVEKIGTYGTGPNKVAVIIGVHPLESSVHQAMWDAIKTTNLTNVRVDVFRVVLTSGATDYETTRLQGETLAKNFVVPNIDRSYKLVIDIHGNRGNYIDPNTGFVVKDFMYAPSNGTLSKSYANKLINKSNGTLVYYYVSGTSPSEVTIPITQKGIPAVIYELYFIGVDQSVLNSKCLILVNALNSITYV